MKTALASDFDNTLYFMNTEERFRAQDVFEILCADGETSLRFKLLELWGNLTR